jgi:two-component system response regulator HydG
MAGSYVSTRSDVPSLLHARLEGLKLLAQHVDEPIVIFNPQMELVYANPAADRMAGDCPLVQNGPKESQVLDSLQQLHCDPCPGKLLFEDIPQPSHNSDSLPTEFSQVERTCPFPRAVPVQCEEGITHFSVLMGDRGCESVIRGSGERPPFSLPDKPAVDEAQELWRGIIGGSAPIQQLVEMIQLVAASEATVLIQGESGTGKELVARTIHELSRRREYPFVVVECSALPETLLESELFGHVRGAFTGAVNSRKGLFEEAEGGTIFLDEIADTTPAFQARLLRVLQEREIKPVGSNRSVRVNVRVISAGNKPLEELVKTKHFRADLYYRLAVLPLTVPPLRERKEDIPLLAEYFLDRSTRLHGRLSLTMHPDAQRALSQYAWPGNVRELENLVERAVVTCRYSTIRASDLFGKQGVHGTKGALRVVSKAARQEAERDHILQALSETQGDKTRAARLLKISRSNLYNKLRLYHIQ